MIGTQVYRLYFGTSRGHPMIPQEPYRDVLKRLFEKHNIAGATVTNGLGYWEGEWESSVVLELVDVTEWVVNPLARDICKEFKQDVVLIVRHEGAMALVGAGEDERAA